jgi:hypothetical protein
MDYMTILGRSELFAAGSLGIDHTRGGDFYGCLGQLAGLISPSGQGRYAVLYPTRCTVLYAEG